MPIDAELRRALYNRREWKEARERVRARAGWRCECHGECGRVHRDDGGYVGRCEETRRRRLTVAHVDHDTGVLVADARLALFCSACHLRYDSEQHWTTRRRRERQELEQRGQGRLV